MCRVKKIDLGHRGTGDTIIRKPLPTPSTAEGQGQERVLLEPVRTGSVKRGQKL